MSLYTFAPSPDVAGREEYFASWDGGFSESEITKVITYGDNLIRTSGQDATVGDSTMIPEVRKSKVAWIDHNMNTGWLYDKLGYIARQVNGLNFGFDLTGFSDDFQYTVYTGQEQSFYDWHMDKGYSTNGAPPRKLSMVLQLSDPSEYEGGDLQMRVGGVEEIITLEKSKGKIHLFPSWVLHRVTPVTRGTRKSLVVWIAGPKFR